MAESGANGSQLDETMPHTNGNVDDVASPASDAAAPASKDQVTLDVQPSNPVSPPPQVNSFSQQNGVSKEAPATPDVLHENGNVPSADVEDGSAEDSTDNPAREAEEPIKRMYFVRMPKPQEDNQYAVKALQEEIDVYKSQVQLLNESMNIVKMERDSTKNSVQDARENLNAAREAFDAKQREVDPLQQGRKQQGDAQRSFQQEYRDLEARSEAELDAKIKGMEFHMSHESMPIAEERNMVRHIKKLQDQRQRVRQYEAQFADVEEARATARSNVGELKELQQERQVLFEDKQLQQTILNKHRDELRALDEKLNEIKDERARVKEQQDSAYHRMQALRNQSRGKRDAYYQNRRFSQEVRKLVKEGKLEEAKQMCEEQTDAALGHLHTNASWREEYLELWKHQRPPPFRIGYDDYDFDEVPSQSGAGQKGRAGRAAPVLTGKEKAQAIIAQALAEVRQDLTRKANNSGGMAESLPGGSLPQPQPMDTPHPAPAQPAPAQAAPAVKPPKPSKPAKAAKPVEVPPVVDQREEEPFAPPAAVQKAETQEKPDAEVVRQQQARAQEEAQKRKDKAAERKKKLAQKRKAQAAELKAQESAAKTQAADQQQKPEADPATEEGADGVAGPSTEPLAAASTTVANVAASVADKASVAAKQAPAQANRAMSKAQKKTEALKRKLAVPKARNVRREKGWKQYATQCLRQTKQWGTSHPAELSLGVVVVLLVVMCLWLFSSSSSSVQSVS